MPFIYKGLAHVSNRNTLRPNIKIFSNWEGPSPATFVLVKLTGFRPKSTEASVRNSATVDSRSDRIRLLFGLISLSFKPKGLSFDFGRLPFPYRRLPF